MRHYWRYIVWFFVDFEFLALEGNANEAKRDAWFY